VRKIASARLTLEPLTRAHAPEMFATLDDPAIYHFIDEAPPVSLEALAERYARLESRRSGDRREHWLNWVVRDSTSGKALGFVQATVAESGSAFVAYVIAPASQGHGFGREATAAMIAELQASYGVRKLSASVDVRNAASLALLGALGFTQARREGGDAIFERRLDEAA
jgi:RimJ/RimL family protein N-acetyltransferase